MYDFNLLSFSIVLILFFAISVLPGYLLLNIFKKRKYDWLEIIPLSYCLSLFIFALIGLPAYLLSISYTVVISIIILLIIVLSITNIIIFLKKGSSVLKFKKPNQATWVALIISILTIVLILILTRAEFYGDYFGHIGMIRRLAANEIITPYYPLFKDTPNEIYTPYAYNIYRLVSGLIIDISGIDAIYIWKYLTIILTPIQFLAFYFLAKRFVADSKYTTIAVITYFIFYGLINAGWSWQLSPYPDQIARNILAPVVIGSFIYFLRQPTIKWRDAILVIVLATITPLIHMFTPVYILLVIVGFLIFGFSTDSKYRAILKSFIVLCGWCVLSIPIIYLVYKAYTKFSSTEFIAFEQKIKWITDNLFIVKPERWLEFWPIFATCLLIVVIIYYFFVKKKKKFSIPLLYCTVVTFFIIISVLVPPVATFLGKVITTTYLARLILILPIVLIISFSIYLLIKQFPNIVKYKNCLIALAIILLPIVSIKLFNKIGNIDWAEQQEIYGNPMYKYINENISPDKVIAANSKTSYYLTAATDNYVVMIPEGHCASIKGIDIVERSNDLNKIVQSMSDIGNTKKLASKYEVDYILTRYFDDNQQNKFSENPDYFNLVKCYQEYNTCLYKIIK